MQYQITSSFEKTLSTLDDKRKQRVKDAVKKTVVFFETGYKPKGLGIKKLRSNYWEIRAGMKDRIIFKLSDDLVQWIIVGNHEEIKRYLKQVK